MKINSFLKLIVYVLISYFSPSQAFSQTKATLPNGEKVILNSDGTYEYEKGITYRYDFTKLSDNQIPEFLRQGISANKQIIRTAIEMYEQGWQYTMPKPKSAQATWGNYDRRTTWWKGYWHNTKTNKYSNNTPQKNANGYYYGDEQNNAGFWGNGGSPQRPSKIQWLLSSSGGVKPN